MVVETGCEASDHSSILRFNIGKYEINGFPSEDFETIASRVCDDHKKPCLW